MNIAVYCGSSSGNDEKYIESAKRLGTWIGKSGNTLVYGGANKGLMGALADSVLENGGKVIGVLPNVPRILERKHMGLTECINTDTMAERKAKMIELADAFVALPGGIGTLDEITDVLSLSETTVGEESWRTVRRTYSLLRNFPGKRCSSAVIMILSGMQKRPGS